MLDTALHGTPSHSHGNAWACTLFQPPLPVLWPPPSWSWPLRPACHPIPCRTWIRPRLQLRPAQPGATPTGLIGSASAAARCGGANGGLDPITEAVSVGPRLGPRGPARHGRQGRRAPWRRTPTRPTPARLGPARPRPCHLRPDLDQDGMTARRGGATRHAWHPMPRRQRLLRRAPAGSGKGRVGLVVQLTIRKSRQYTKQLPAMESLLYIFRFTKIK